MKFFWFACAGLGTVLVQTALLPFLGSFDTILSPPPYDLGYISRAGVASAVSVLGMALVWCGVVLNRRYLKETYRAVLFTSIAYLALSFVLYIFIALDLAHEIEVEQNVFLTVLLRLAYVLLMFGPLLAPLADASRGLYRRRTGNDRTVPVVSLSMAAIIVAGFSWMALANALV